MALVTRRALAIVRVPRYFRTFGALAAASAASVLASLLISIAFARIAGAAAYGTFQIALAAGGFVGVLTISGSATAATRAAAAGRVAAWPLFVRRLPHCLVGAAVMVAIGGILVVVGDTSLGAAFVAGGLVLPLLIGANVYPAHVLGARRYREYLIYQLVVQSTSAVAVVGAVVWRPEDPWLALLAYGGVTGAAQLARLLTLREQADFHPEDLVYAHRLTMAGVVAALAARADVLVTGAVLGTRDAGIVAIARLFPQFLKRVWEVIQPPFFVRMVAGGGGEAAAVARRYRVRLVLTLGGVAACGIVAAPFVIPVVFGREFDDAILLAQILLGAAIVAFFAFLDELAFRARGDLRQLTFVYTVPAVVSLSLLVPFVIAFGVIGVGLAALANAVVYVSLTSVLFRRAADAECA